MSKPNDADVISDDSNSSSGRLSEIFDAGRIFITRTSKTAIIQCWVMLAVVYVGSILGVSIFQGFFVGKNNELNAIELGMKYTCDNIAETFQGSWNDTIFLSQSTAALFAALEYSVSRDHFHRFYAQGKQFADVKILQAIEWIPYVQTEGERASFEAEGQTFTADAFADWNFTFHSGGQTVTGADLEPYFPVQYVEPFTGNEVALGFNLAGNPARLEAIERSWTEKTSIASSRITLVQSVVPQFGFLYFTPMYYDLNETSLHGFILAVFKIDEMLIKALEKFELGGIDVFLFDATDADADDAQYLAHYRQGSDSEKKAMLFEQWKDAQMSDVIGSPYATTAYDIDVGKREWRLVCAPREEYISERQTNIAWIIFGLSLSMALCQTAINHQVKKRKEKKKNDVESLIDQAKDRELEYALPGTEV